MCDRPRRLTRYRGERCTSKLRLNGTFTRGLPSQRELAFVNRTIPQIQIDQRLIGDSRLGRQSLEVCDRRGIEADRDRLFEFGGVGISRGVREIVLFPHGFHLWS